MAELTSFIKVNCEWDIGQEGALFISEASARKWVEQAIIDSGIEDGIEDLESEGLVNYETWEVVYD